MDAAEYRTTTFDFPVVEGDGASSRPLCNELALAFAPDDRIYSIQVETLALSHWAPSPESREIRAVPVAELAERPLEDGVYRFVLNGQLFQLLKWTPGASCENAVYKREEIDSHSKELVIGGDVDVDHYTVIDDTGTLLHRGEEYAALLRLLAEYEEDTPIRVTVSGIFGVNDTIETKVVIPLWVFALDDRSDDRLITYREDSGSDDSYTPLAVY